MAYRVIGAAAEGKIGQMTAGGGRSGGFSAAGYELAHTWARSAIAEALGDLGQIDMALALLDEARELMERNDERYVESEIYRVNGQLKLKQLQRGASTAVKTRGAELDAEQSFLKAIEIARERGAKTLELRAAIGLSRMYLNGGESAEALRILQPIHDWFTEGLDWPELKTAKAILSDLKSASSSSADPQPPGRSLAR
jgi:tetratricopeptide (TPR) repeat protein